MEWTIYLRQFTAPLQNASKWWRSLLTFLCQETIMCYHPQNYGWVDSIKGIKIILIISTGVDRGSIVHIIELLSVIFFFRRQSHANWAFNSRISLCSRFDTEILYQLKVLNIVSEGFVYNFARKLRLYRRNILEILLLLFSVCQVDQETVRNNHFIWCCKNSPHLLLLPFFANEIVRR